MFQKIIFLLTAFAISNANAVPLLRQTEGDFSEEMVTIYPDHADPNLFYFLPNTGNVAMSNDGHPMMGLTITGINNSIPDDGLGFLSFVLEASITPKVRTELKKFKQLHPNARLTVVPFGKSYVSMLRADGQAGMSQAWSPLIKTLDLPPAAGVAETQVGVNMLLTEAGSKIFKASIEGSQPYNMGLCFEVYGALPVMHAKVFMNYKQIYNYFAGSVSTGFLWWGVSLSHVTETLVREGAISINILGGDAKFEDYIKNITAELAKTYLVPVLSAGPVQSGHDLLRPGVQLSFNSVYKEERASATVEVKKQEFITDSRCVNLPMTNIRPYISEVIHVID